MANPWRRWRKERTRPGAMAQAIVSSGRHRDLDFEVRKLKDGWGVYYRKAKMIRPAPRYRAF